MLTQLAPAVLYTIMRRVGLPLVLALLAGSCSRTEAGPPPPPAAPAPISMPRDADVRPGVFNEDFRTRRLPVQGPVRRGPYVQAVGPAEATVCFETVEETAGALKCDGRTEKSPRGIRHEIVIRGLRPATRYDFTIEPGGAAGSLKTPPGEDGELFFIVWGDSRTYYERLARVAELAARDKPDFTVHTGDLVEEGTVEEDWDRFFESAAPLLRTGALWPAMGNHEHGAKQYLELFVLPQPRSWYSFTAGQAQFFVLDSNWTSRRDPRQVEWFSRELKASKARFRFVVCHHPLVSCPDDDFIFDKESSMVALYGKAIEEAGVTAVFQGHNHNYQRAERRGILYLTTGGAGAPLYPVGTLTPETKFAREVHHYVRIRLSGHTMSLEAVDWTGQVIDRDEKTVP